MAPLQVVVEPGHGGKDPGAVGHTTTERDVVTAVAQSLAGHFSGAAVTYILKRRNFFPDLLRGLLRWIRRRRPPVVLSLHCDSAPGEHHRATVRWWAQDPDSRREALSRGLAALIANELQRQSVATSAGAVSCPYERDGRPYTPGVLINTARDAAVLVELGFISDVHVEATMITPGWVQRAASALDTGIRSYMGG